MDQENINYFAQPSSDEAANEPDAESVGQPDSPFGFLTPSEDGESWVLGEAEAEPETPGNDQPDLDTIRAELEQLRQERDQYASRIGSFEVQAQQAAVQQAAQQWDQLEAQARAYAETLDQRDAINYMAWFGNQRNEAVRQNAQQMVYQTQAQAYADDIIKQFGLKDEDRILLGTDTRNFPVIAERLRKERDEMDRRFAEMQKQVKNTNLHQQARRRIETNADRMGPTGRAVPYDWTKLDSNDQLRAMWGLPMRSER